MKDSIMSNVSLHSAVCNTSSWMLLRGQHAKTVNKVGGSWISKLPVFPHVHIQASFLGIGSITEPTLIRFLASVDSLVGLQVVFAREILAADLTQMGGLPQMPLAVNNPQVSFEELLWAVLALELLPVDVLDLPVAKHGALGWVRFPAAVTHEGLRSRTGAVLVGFVPVKARLDGKHGAANVTLVFLKSLAGLTVSIQQVKFQTHRLRKLSSTQVAQRASLTDLEQGATILFGQLLAIWTQANAAGKTLWVDADVLSCFQPCHGFGAAVKTHKPSFSATNLPFQTKQRENKTEQIGNLDFTLLEHSVPSKQNQMQHLE